LTLLLLLLPTYSFYCNVTEANQAKAAADLRKVYDITPLKLSFRQSGGYLIRDIASKVPSEIKMDPVNKNHLPCVLNYQADIIPYLNLAFEDQFFGTQASNVPSPSQSQIWSALNKPTSWIYSMTTYLSTIDLVSSEKSQVVIKMKYCRDYKSFQDDSLECPLVDEESERAKLLDKSLKGLAIGLTFAALGVTIVFLIIFAFVYTKYEDQADFKQQLAIKKTKKMLVADLQSPEQAHLERVEADKSNLTVQLSNSSTHNEEVVSPE
jgi:hypothetical protein